MATCSGICSPWASQSECSWWKQAEPRESRAEPRIQPSHENPEPYMCACQDLGSLHGTERPLVSQLAGERAGKPETRMWEYPLRVSRTQCTLLQELLNTALARYLSQRIHDQTTIQHLHQSISVAAAWDGSARPEIRPDTASGRHIPTLDS